MAEHSCAHQGHIWLESDGTVFNRKRDLSNQTPIEVTCRHCTTTATMVGYGAKR